MSMKQRHSPLFRERKTQRWEKRDRKGGEEIEESLGREKNFLTSKSPNQKICLEGGKRDGHLKQGCRSTNGKSIKKKRRV